MSFPSFGKVTHEELKNDASSILSLEMTQQVIQDLLLILSDRCRLRVVTLRACYRAPTPQNPENTQKIRNPPPRVGPRKYEKNTEKIQKRPKMAILGVIFVFFRYFFRIFGGQPGVGDFVFFAYFRGSGVLGLCSRPAGSQTQSQKLVFVCEALFRDQPTILRQEKGT